MERNARQLVVTGAANHNRAEVRGPRDLKRHDRARTAKENIPAAAHPSDFRRQADGPCVARHASVGGGYDLIIVLAADKGGEVDYGIYWHRLGSLVVRP